MKSGLANKQHTYQSDSILIVLQYLHAIEKLVSHLIVGLKEINVGTRNWIGSAKDRDYLRALANAVLDLRVS